MTAATDPAPASALALAPTELYIDGAWHAGGRHRTIEVEDPATGRRLAAVADAEPDDAMRALGAAHDSFPAFRRVPARERGELLRRVHDAMIAVEEELAVLMTLEMGKALAESRAEVRYAAAFLRWYAEEAVRINGRFQASESGDSRLLTVPEPVGPCLLITPWNFPLAMGTRKIGPALAAGCTCVVKPARQTPLSMLALARIFHEAGVPPGVLNVIVSSRSGAVTEPLLTDARLRKLSFTGSTAVGRRLLELSSAQVLRVSMELGGNAPFIVFDDADLERALDGAVTAKMRNTGEACTSANRFLVQERLAGSFAAGLAERLAAMPVGPGLEPDVQVGPLIDADAVSAMRDLVADAVSRGAEILTGGHAPDGAGHFFEPTVLAEVPADARVMREEIFGPVAPIVTFRDEAEAVALANSTEYGLVAYVYTRDVDRAFRVSEALDTGMVGVNRGLVSGAGAPFGGVKHSGFGREGGPEGILEYLELKYLSIDVGAKGDLT